MKRAWLRCCSCMHAQYAEDAQFAEVHSALQPAVSLRMEEMKKFIKVEVDLYPDAGGIAIIICNNYIGVNSKQPPLYGSIKDASEMDSTFKHIKFAIIKIDNAKRDIMINLIQAVAQYKFPDSYKSVVFIFSGHGNGKPAVISSDDLGIDLNEDIIEPLGVSETLEGKTKIALIAACRTIGKEEEAKPLTVYNKFLVAFSTRHGTGAYEKDNGCPWIQGLAKEIKKVSLSIGKILLKVNTEVKECTGQDSQFINSTVDICLGLESVASASEEHITTDSSEIMAKYTAKTVMGREISSPSVLNSITWKNPSGEKKKLSLKMDMSPHWYTLGQNVNISEAKLLEIKGKAGNDSNSKYMNDVLTEWIGKKSKKYPPTWEGLVKWLRNEQLNNLADKIEQAANDPTSTLYETEED